MVSRLTPFRRVARNMDLMTFWESVAALRRAELVFLLITMIVPLVSGTLLLAIRHRIHTLQNIITHTQGAFYHDSVERLKSKNQTLGQTLNGAAVELTRLRHATAPRALSPLQEDVLIEKLSGVKASPVIVAAYAFEEESASYAEQIAGALRRAGWDVTVNKASMNDFKGISLGKVNLMNQPVTGLHELAQAFTEARLELRQRDIHPDSIAGALQDGALLVVVGRK